MKKQLLLSLLMAAGMTASGQQENVPVQTGTYSPEWESLSAWECPEWFKDAKFGIWAHWGPQCHAEAGDWYARFMYFDGFSQNQWHYEHFGDPAEFGLKDLCNDWKAQNWNPEQLVSLYKSVGARYFMALGNHHDNFDLWDSPYQEWNSVNIGPKKDILKGWSDACKKAGLPMGVSIHASHAWTWLEPSTDYDGTLTKADGYKLNTDGTEKWWKGLDPQELYAQDHPHSTGWENSGTIHSQWDWGNGASLPSAAYKQKFQNRVLEMMNDYDPAMVYFDDTAMPFYGCDDEIGKNILAHYYNTSAAKNGGTPNVVVTGKQLTTAQKDYMLWDVERGIPDRIQEDYWQTCTCIGSWHYDSNTYKNGSYKSAQQVVDMLVDIVSKNGNLLLSIPVKGDGTIDEKEEAILADIKAWMDVNSSSVYGTRPWKTFGEGPLADAANPLSAQGFNEGNNYSSKDVRYVQRNDTVFATIMRWPASKTYTFESFGKASEYYSGKVKSVKLLGREEEVAYTEGVDGVTVTLPAEKPNAIAPVFLFTFDEETAVKASLAEIIEGYRVKVVELASKTSYNTGKYSKEGIQAFEEALTNAEQYVDASEANQKVIIAQLKEAYKTLKTNGRNLAAEPAENGAEDVTEEFLQESSNFSAETMGSRFGTPAYWTVENYTVPMKNDKVGVKNGIDNYPGYNTLNLGVWSGEDVEPYTCDLSNARIYQKVHLEPGRYFFGAKFEANYNAPDASYIFAADELMSTEALEDGSIAFAHIGQCGAGKFFGIYFNVDKEQDLYLGFQTDIASGASQQEFRASDVKLLYYGNMDFDALSALILSADQVMSEAVVNANTGFYSKESVAKLEAAISAADNIPMDASYETFMEAYNALVAAVEDFKVNGRNVGGAPMEANAQDLTLEKLKEAGPFARTDETNDGDRFAAAKNWTVENFGFGDQAGIDNISGSDCLHLEVWWNSNAFPENGYDIHNARIYQKTELPAGRYFFGACYPGYEPNDDSYIFVSEDVVSTDELSSLSIAYEKVNLAPRDGSSYRGVYFTLEKATEVYLGFQADFSASQTANVRVKGIKLLYYGELSYAKLQALATTIEADVEGMKVNQNTGFYSVTALAQLQQAIADTKAVSESADYETISDAYNALNAAYTDFKENGKNVGGQPELLDATDITEEKLTEASGFSRADAIITTRFATPKYWTVENFQIPNGGDGTKNGLDKYPGYDCLMLGIWNDRDNNESGNLANARVYQKVHLEAGRYYFGHTLNTIYNLTKAYLFAADELLATDEIPELSVAYQPMTDALADGQFYGIYFTLDEAKDIYLGFQADLANGNSAQEFRADKVVLYGYNMVADAIEEMPAAETSGAPRFYSLMGIELPSAPQHGFFVVKQGAKSFKGYRK